jgi:subtilisin family serine protease
MATPKEMIPISKAIPRAVGMDGIHASYSTPGASVLVTAPGGDNGSNGSGGKQVMAMAGNNKCDNAGIGTSFACLVVSGVVALILEANPNLSWRDVQGILATRPLPHSTSDSDIAEDTLAHVNGAGLWYSNLYGFGIINAGAAVLAAESWDLFGPEKMLLGESGRINLLIAVDQE